ncbi:2Fe-2S iron-sulfur cluster-binding protein [Pelotomaculum propionicicum]|uniref:succinate dehydrogenase n=1 Tax=Pelotomaculum propionicicum TaxID=258475 RepID=A0A4Y7RJ52_9FIRM|nr:2Fe-2S iron-sulfur cluster-binding protein [Pelotomaculum propionicicum]NLI12185.1 4Fe-4S dicluster domain-containing protein [Peptococcaceae bacterium]TEB09048.1 Fumarate reductase iron-sulfur subunit [Pelotomaculum propionicicum]
MLNVDVQRYSPGKNAAPYRQIFQVPLETGISVLGLLDYIRKNLDETFAYKIYCTNQHCGECGLMLNGKPVLACRDMITTENVVLDPLKGFKVIKDLVVDVDSVIRKQWSEFPVLEGKMVYNDFLTEDQHSLFFMAGACIGCAICQSVCCLHKEDDVLLKGPAYYAALAQYMLRAKTKEDFLAYLNTAVEHGILQCISCKQCSKNCPKDVEPYKVITAIAKLIHNNLGINVSKKLLAE